MNSDRTTDYVLLLLLALIWSTSFLLIKIALETTGPFTLTATRLLIAAIILGLITVLRGTSLPTNKNALWLYLVVGILGNTLPFSLISLGEVTVDSSLTAILMGIMPISTFVLAHWFIPSESMTLRKVIGVGCGVTGLLALIGLSAFSDFGNDPTGQLIILAGALCYSVTAIFVRTRPSFDGFQMAAGAAIVAAVSCLCLAFWFEKPFDQQPDNNAIASIVALGIFHTAISGLIYFRVIANLGAVTFAQINYLIPVLGSIWGVWILSERISWNTWLALGLVLVGVYFIQPKTTGKQA